MNLFPMHSWHPMVIHFPVVGFLLGAGLDLVASWGQRPAWRNAAGWLWGIGLAGAAAAIATGLLAYGRVDHSDPAHELMTDHRNLAYATTALMVVVAVWRWRRPFSRIAAVFGVAGAAGVTGVGYLGGELVFRHALGIPTETLGQVRRERLGPEADPGTTVRPDSLSHMMPGDSAAASERKPHTHAPGKEHD